MRRTTTILTTLVLVTSALIMSSPAAADPIIPVTVSIPRVIALQDPDPAPGQAEADMYAKVSIDGFPTQQSAEVSDDADAQPIPVWTFTRNVDAALSPITINIEVLDADTALAAPDDVIDLNPVDNKLNLTLILDLDTGNWTFGGDPIPNNATSSTGDGDTEHAGIFEGGERGQIFFDVSTQSTTGDADSDGLLDGWESRGFDADGDGTVDVDLPAFGADPLHKDLFLELDYEAGQSPARADIQAMKSAFRAAPLGNPDGTNGVNLWVDMGNLVDAGAREGQAPNTCSDGIDNGGDGQADGGDTDCRFLDGSVEDPQPTNCSDGVDNDGDTLADANDPDCLVGDNLGGGSVVPTVGACNLDGTFYGAKATNFNTAQRGWIFRYALSLALAPSCPSSGGWGEIGGNDFMDFNHDGGTVLHELGHTLNLRHGGNENNNCKPNYVSGMNYDNQFGINRVGGGTIIDYSPPRRALNGSTRGNAPLANLVENDLDDGAVLDASDANNRYVFVNPAGAKVQFRLDQAANWNSDVDPPLELNQSVNIDTNATGGGPAACNNGSNNDTLEGFNDWNAVSIPFRQFGDSADGAINPVTGPEPTLNELVSLAEDLNTTDLAVAITDSPDPVAAGTQLQYTLRATNIGPNPATSVQIADTLPSDVTFASASAGCTHSAGIVTCNLGDLAANATRDVTVTVNVPADLVYTNGGPKSITDSATISNLAGPDSNNANNSDSESTQVIAVADVQITGISTSSPLEVLIGEPASATVDVSVQNDGPSSPIDAVLSGTASASTGATVTPASTTEAVDALTGAPPRSVSQDFTLSCTQPGVKTVSFEYSLALTNAADTDPDLTNNTRQASFQIDCVVPIAVNVRPHGFPNSINLNTDATLAALTTQAGEYGLPLDFDARTILIDTVRWGLRSNLFNVAVAAGASEIHGTLHEERSYELDEKTRDRDLDGVMHFKPADSGLTIDTTEGCLKGRFRSGLDTFTFLGCDSVIVRPS